LIHAIIVMVELALTLMLPFLMCFNIFMNRRVVYADLYYLCPGVYLRNTISTALSVSMGVTTISLVVRVAFARARQC
jgi:hypothetical protein